MLYRNEGESARHFVVDVFRMEGEVEEEGKNCMSRRMGNEISLALGAPCLPAVSCSELIAGSLILGAARLPAPHIAQGL